MVIATEISSDHPSGLDHGGVTRWSGRPKPGKSYQAPIVENHGPSPTRRALGREAVLFSHRDSLGWSQHPRECQSRTTPRVDRLIWARSVRSMEIICHARKSVND